MFLMKYLDEFKLELIYSNYEEKYISSLDEENFKEIYDLFIEYGFDELDDIIVNYLEIFEMDSEYVAKAFKELSTMVDGSLSECVDKDITILSRVINLVNMYQENEDND